MEAACAGWITAAPQLICSLDTSMYRCIAACHLPTMLMHRDARGVRDMQRPPLHRPTFFALKLGDGAGWLFTRLLSGVLAALPAAAAPALPSTLAVAHMISCSCGGSSRRACTAREAVPAPAAAAGAGSRQAAVSLAGD